MELFPCLRCSSNFPADNTSRDEMSRFTFRRSNVTLALPNPAEFHGAVHKQIFLAAIFALACCLG